MLLSGDQHAVTWSCTRTTAATKLLFWQSPWNKKALIGSLIISTLICAPLPYVPYLSTKVSKHYRGSWEWGMITCMGVTLIGLCKIYHMAADAAA